MSEPTFLGKIWPHDWKDYQAGRITYDQMIAKIMPGIDPRTVDRYGRKLEKPMTMQEMELSGRFGPSE